MAENKSGQDAVATEDAYQGFSLEERAAMKQRARELKTEARRGARANEAGGEADVLAAIAKLPESDRLIAERLHAIIRAAAPELTPKTWYGFPAYAKDGKNVCFYQDANKFKSRYGELGFSDKANLDDGNMWPCRYALRELTPAVEARIAELVKKAAS